MQRNTTEEESRNGYAIHDGCGAKRNWQ